MGISESMMNCIELWTHCEAMSTCNFLYLKKRNDDDFPRHTFWIFDTKSNPSPSTRLVLMKHFFFPEDSFGNTGAREPNSITNKILFPLALILGEINLWQHKWVSWKRAPEVFPRLFQISCSRLMVQSQESPRRSYHTEDVQI